MCASQFGRIEKTVGVLLVLTGVAFLTGGFQAVSVWLIDDLSAVRADRVRRVKEKPAVSGGFPLTAMARPPVASGAPASRDALRLVLLVGDLAVVALLPDVPDVVDARAVALLVIGDRRR